ncbi:MAG TPA: response regulator [Nitrospirota bacterium]|nr:response regulator [Nitrospirota bacterium]
MNTILIVDDEPEILDSVSEVLRKCGYNVIPRSDGESALSYVNGDNPVDLVISDYRLPGITGLDILMAIRQRTPNLPVIFFTGNGTIENYLKATALGVFEFLNKPVRMKDLSRIVDAALRNEPAGEAEGTGSRRSKFLP